MTDSFPSRACAATLQVPPLGSSRQHTGNIFIELDGRDSSVRSKPKNTVNSLVQEFDGERDSVQSSARSNSKWTVEEVSNLLSETRIGRGSAFSRGCSK